jgi:hypothetical protein
MSAQRSNDDRSRKLFIRAALVSGSTVATLIGAQSLTWIDAARFAITATPDSSAEVSSSTNLQAEAAITHIAPSLAIHYSPPSLVVLRRAGVPSQTSASLNPSGQSAPVSLGSIQPPAPIVNQQQTIVVDQPVIVQQPVYVQQGGSSASAPAVVNSRASR